ncbi:MULTISPECIES: YggT family protein [Planococcaceae]|uniref:YggT family protein n=1 Tax=Planococcus halotolerans TaxID=2233542 RepID=A0A365L1T5_9BACL|nr:MULTISPECIES: YggT family protein [Planococcaceae]QHJ70893.1 YggT family protein [Planococcus halotolerans]RAZ79352.1 YggT family protein [Planococcus halotolerans]RLQ92838.1 YggT family protein [Planomicrobium sp. Y74]
MAYIELFILTAVNIYFYLIIASVLMSWIPSIKESRVGQFITSLTDPYLDIFRKFIPPLGMIDISPIIAIYTLLLASRGISVLFGML